MPIHKRLEVEIETRKNKLQKLKNIVDKEREEREILESKKLEFPRTKLSYEVQRRRAYVNKSHSLGGDFDGEKDPNSSHMHFINFLRDHQAWEFRKKKKIEQKREKKEESLEKQLTFAPKINPKSYQILPKYIEPVEQRLMKRHQEHEEKLARVRSAQKLTFTPTIYHRNQNR